MLSHWRHCICYSVITKVALFAISNANDIVCLLCTYLTILPFCKLGLFFAQLLFTIHSFCNMVMGYYSNECTKSNKLPNCTSRYKFIYLIDILLCLNYTNVKWMIKLLYPTLSFASYAICYRHSFWHEIWKLKMSRNKKVADKADNSSYAKWYMLLL